MEIPLFVTSCFSLACFKILSLLSTFIIFNYNMSWCGLPWIHLVWNFLCFLDPDVCSLFQVWKVSVFISWNQFSAPLFPSSCSWIPIMQMFVCLILEVSQTISFFKMLFSPLYSGQHEWFPLFCLPDCMILFVSSNLLFFPPCVLLI